RGSYNRLLLQHAAAHPPAALRLQVFDDLGSVPLFSEDLEAEGVPEPVHRLRDLVAGSDGLLIATPEYNQSMPGVLKNAIDWLSRGPSRGPGPVLSGKPVAIIGASGGRWGTRLAQSHLRRVLYATESLVMPQPSLFIAGAGGMFDESGNLMDVPVSETLRGLLAAFGDWIDRVAARVPG